MSAATARSREAVAGWLFAAPAVILLALFTLWPALAATGLSFTDFQALAPGSGRAIGFENYVRAFNDPSSRLAAKNTVLFAVMATPLQVSLALCLALVLDLPFRGRRFFRALFFSPVLLSAVVASVIWSYVYHPSGLLNLFLTSAGLPRQRFLLDQGQALPALAVMSTWQNAGFYMVIFVAGLRRIPRELYDAALVDGANYWGRLRFVTLPLLRRTTGFVTIAATVYALRLFTEVYVLTRGGPAGATRTVVYLVWEEGLRFSHTGYAAALAVLFTLAVVAIASLQRRLVASERAR